MPKAKPVIFAKIPVHSLKVLMHAAWEYTQLAESDSKWVRADLRAIKTAERAITLAQLRKGIFKDENK